MVPPLVALVMAMAQAVAPSGGPRGGPDDKMTKAEPLQLPKEPKVSKIDMPEVLKMDQANQNHQGRGVQDWNV